MDLTTRDGIKHLFSPFKLYQCFDVATSEGSNLEAVLKYLMCYPNDDLRQASVTLLDDIYKVRCMPDQITLIGFLIHIQVL